MMERCTSEWGEKQGRGREGERMMGMQKRLLLSPMALMWAEDKVRLEIGMPEAHWGERKRAGDGRSRSKE